MFVSSCMFKFSELYFNVDIELGDFNTHIDLFITG